MPYEGEFASYRPLNRVAETERVKNLLRRARVFHPTAGADPIVPAAAPVTPPRTPDFVVAIDGSYAEVEVENGYPGARVGYCTVASVLLNIAEMKRVDEQRPVDPRVFRRLEEAATLDAALPGCNVVTRTHTSAVESFREAVYELLHDVAVDQDDRAPLLDTYEALLALKPTTRTTACPYASEGCQQSYAIPRGISSCPCEHRRPVYSTDALRIHERFHDIGSNGESYGEVMQVAERVLLVHILRCFERRGWLDRAHRLAFVLDGPLAVFGHPAWLSAALKTELSRLNAVAKASSGEDLLIIGVEKTGMFVDHFEQVDSTNVPGEVRFGPRTYLLPTDRYIKKRVIFSESPKRYGADTYFGRKFLYKTATGARIVGNIPFLRDEQDTLDSDDIALYPALPATFRLLDDLVSARYENALTPLVTAHAHAAIPLNLGAKVLEQLARALMRE